MLPQLLLNRKESGIGGGDFNSVMDSVDSNSSSVNKCTNLGELVKTFNMKDCYRELMPKGRDFSRYSHGSIGGSSMSRIDRCYRYGTMAKPIKAEYLFLPFSDHFGHIVTFEVAEPLSKLLLPQSRPTFKIKPDTIRDQIFQNRISDASKSWGELMKRGINKSFLWEEIIKKNLGVLQQKEVEK